MIDQSISFKALIPVDKNSSAPIYQQIAKGLIALIQRGQIVPGSKIPSSRQMADLFQLHRKTIVAAYEELAQQDWIETIPRKGVFISNKLPGLKPQHFRPLAISAPYNRKTAGFFLKTKQPFSASRSNHHFELAVNDGFPDARIAPIAALLKQYRHLLGKSYAQHAFMVGDPAGARSLRTEIAAYIGSTRAINISYENIIITRGAQMAIFLAASMILKPGSTVMVGEPGYFMANNIFEHFGARLTKVPVDEHGIDVAAIERICRKKRPDLLYVIPHHHHPTTVTLSAERRMSLVSIISRYKLPVIEDDYDYDFHYSKTPILPLASGDHNGYVLYIGSVTKSFASSIRVGYLVAGKEFIDHAAGIREMIDIRGDVLMEEALATLYANGDMQRHLHKAAKIYQERRDYLCALLADELAGVVTYAKPSGGMALWVTFSPGYDLPAIAKKMAGYGIFISDGTMYNTAATNYNSLRIGFASMGPQEMDKLVSALRQAAADCQHLRLRTLQSDFT